MATANQIDIRLALSGLSSVTGGLAKVQNVFRTFQNVLAVAGISASVAELFNLAKSAIDAADELGKMAQRTGVAVEELSSLAYAGKLSGVSLTELQGGLKHLAQEMSNTGKGGQSVYDELLRISDQFSRMPDSAAKTSLAVEHFGKTGQNLIPLLNGGSAAIKAQAEEARKLGVVVSAEFARQAEIWNDSLTKIKTGAQGTMQQIAEKILPALNTQLAEFNSVTSKGTLAVNIATNAFKGLWYTTEGLGFAMAYVGEHLYALEQTIKGNKFYSLRENLRLLEEDMRQRIERMKTDLGELKAATDGAKPPGPAAFHESLGLKEEIDARLKLEELRTRNTNAAGLTGIDAAREKMEQYVAQIKILGFAMENIRNEMAGKNITATVTGVDGIQRMSKEWFELTVKMEEFQSKVTALQGQLDLLNVDSFAAQFRVAIRLIQSELGTFAQQTAAAFRSVWDTALNSIAHNFTALIRGTQTWGQALQNIGGSILDTVISSIVRMFAAWIASMTVMKLLSKLFHTESTTDAAKSAAAWAPAAVAVSIVSGGLAAVAGAAAAIAAMTAGAVAGGAIASAGYESGGWTGSGGNSEIAGLVHRNEFVLPAPVVQRVGLPTLENLRAGGELAPAGAGASQPVIVGLHDSRRSAQLWAESMEGEKTILEIVGRNVHRFQRRS